MTIVDYTAEWCPACLQIAPLFEKLSHTYTDVQFLKVNVDNFEEMSLGAEVSAMPSYIVYEAGKVTGIRLTGADSDALIRLVKSISSIKQSEPSSNDDPVKIKHKPVKENVRKEKNSSKRKHCVIA
jgi:thioredoxin 1